MELNTRRHCGKQNPDSSLSDKKKLSLGKTGGGNGGCSIGTVLKLETAEWAYVYVTFLLSKSICLLFIYPFLIDKLLVYHFTLPDR